MDSANTSFNTHRNVEDALEWYRKQYSDVPFDVFNCSWDDLFGQMARAQGDHEARSGRKGSSSWFKYLWRKAGSKSDAIEPWLHLIPDEYGLSIVRGAIAIVFHMAEKSHEKEKSILEGFEAITDTIRNAMNKGVSFQREPEMHACCQALYDCLVEGITGLIWSLKPETKGTCWELVESAAVLCSKKCATADETTKRHSEQRTQHEHEHEHEQ